MLDQFARWLIALLCGSGALALIAASMFMNFTFWSGQGTDVPTARVLGAVSIVIDVFKAGLPLIIAWALMGRYKVGTLVGCVFFLGCLVFSFAGALGFAWSAKGTSSGHREAATIHLAASEQALKDANAKLLTIAEARPQAVITEALEKAKQDRRWLTSNECKDATLETSRTFCRTVSDLRIELASTIEGENLRAHIVSLQGDISRQVNEGAKLDHDPQAGILTRLSGINLERVQLALTVLFAWLVEFGAAFGLFLAMLPLGDREWRGRVASSGRHAAQILVPEPSSAKRSQYPTRFVRGADGRLMID